MVRFLLVLLAFCTFSLFPEVSYGNQKIRCSTNEVFKQRVLSDPAALQRKAQLESDIQQWIQQQSLNRNSGTAAIVTIPVVVHVVWRVSAENITEQQINSQIDRLNKDYRKLNTDMLSSTHPFYSRAGDANIEFCLAKIDPNGNATSGITRTQTAVNGFTLDEKVKFTAQGGKDGWPSSQYLNIWVCELTGDLLGYAQYPSDVGAFPETDGVVIGYRNFGTMGTAEDPYDLGRTATHEIGHWLNLEHIWGDEGTFDECSDSDSIPDTPNQQSNTFGCPTGVVTDDCSQTSPGIMYQNFMDYTDDACMVLFTSNQGIRMNATLATARASIKTSNKCSGPTGVNQTALQQIRIYPNPVENYLVLEGLPQSRVKAFNLDIYNMLGAKVYTRLLQPGENMIEMTGLKTGNYVLNVFSEDFTATQKITIVK